MLFARWAITVRSVMPRISDVSHAVFPDAAQNSTCRSRLVSAPYVSLSAVHAATLETASASAHVKSIVSPTGAERLLSNFLVLRFRNPQRAVVHRGSVRPSPRLASRTSSRNWRPSSGLTNEPGSWCSSAGRIVDRAWAAAGSITRYPHSEYLASQASG